MNRSMTIVLVGVMALGVLAPGAGAQRSAMSTVIESVDFDQTPAHQAFEWLSVAGGFNLYVNWGRMEARGISRQTPVSMQLSTVPALTALRLLADDVFGDTELIIRINPSFVRIMTRQQANQRPVVRIYDVGDLLHEAPDFDQAPTLDLNQLVADSQDSSGSIFDRSATEREPIVPRSQRGQRIAEAIRNHIEPDLWRANGGIAAQITYYDGRLVVRAPEYVHQKIGIPAVRSTPRAAGSARSAGDRPRASAGHRQRHRPVYRRTHRHASSRSNGVSGIDW